MKKETIKLTEGDLVLYHDKTLMEKATVKGIDKNAGTALLSNKVKITRTASNGEFTRVDGKASSARILPITDETEKAYETYTAYHQAKRALESIKKYLDDKGIQATGEDAERIITIAKKLKKLSEK